MSPGPRGPKRTVRAQLDHAEGRPRSLSVEGLLVVMQINALRHHHVAEIVEHARVLNTLSAPQLDDLGIRDWDPVQAYDRTDRLFNLLAKVLEEGRDAIVEGERVRIDADWFLERWLRASNANLPATSRAVAIDGTDIETWGRLHGQVTDDDLDGVTDLDGDAVDASRPRKARATAAAQLFRPGIVTGPGRWPLAVQAACKGSST